MSKNSGEIKNFDKNWKNRRESNYLHWTKNKPNNQIQLAFRNHWITFRDIIKKNLKTKERKKKVLEVGCGRGSLSAYFSQNGYECYLNDSSKTAIKIANKLFKLNNLNANYNVGDCKKLIYENNKFDIVFSIGLLEHFQNPTKIIAEQVRVLKPGGLIISYVVPNFKSIIQNKYDFFCKILNYSNQEKKKINQKNKTKVFRSKLGIKEYKKIYSKLKLKKIFGTGIYSLPMISHSKDFPFTLLDKKSERLLVSIFQNLLNNYKTKNPWLCKEKFGQAILIVGQKS